MNIVRATKRADVHGGVRRTAAEGVSAVGSNGEVTCIPIRAELSAGFNRVPSFQPREVLTSLEEIPERCCDRAAGRVESLKKSITECQRRIRPVRCGERGCCACKAN